jgi:hypothetical protein
MLCLPAYPCVHLELPVVEIRRAVYSMMVTRKLDFILVTKTKDGTSHAIFKNDVASPQSMISCALSLK